MSLILWWEFCVSINRLLENHNKTNKQQTTRNKSLKLETEMFAVSWFFVVVDFATTAVFRSLAVRLAVALLLRSLLINIVGSLPLSIFFSSVRLFCQQNWSVLFSNCCLNTYSTHLSVTYRVMKKFFNVVEQFEKKRVEMHILKRSLLPLHPAFLCLFFVFPFLPTIDSFSIHSS